MRFLTYEDIIEINKTLVKLLDKHPPKLGNAENLKRIVEDAQNSSDMVTAAATYFYGLNRKHVFYGANKRTSFLATDLFLEMNGRRLAMGREELVKLEVEVRAGSVSFDEVKVLFKDRIRTSKNDETT